MDAVNGPAHTITDSHLTDVGGLPVHRSLPRRERRTVGAWCFLDHFGPVDATPAMTMTVGPHPHIGLHTVTWLLSGEVLHSDSLGSEQPIRPGQLNLMTAGAGIAHAEDGRGQSSGAMEGVQLWVAQPEGTRHGPSSFAHHAELPVVDLHTGQATILIGPFAGAASPARVDSALMGVDIAGSGTIDLPLDPAFEHAIAVLHGDARVDGATATAHQLLYLGDGRDEVRVTLADRSRILLLGGVPFDEEILMWWNFVARDRAEVDQARDDWEKRAARFGEVVSTLDRIGAPRPIWAS
jgi:redox-sensitive bicupin YhaK (pirin superfamily)